MDKTFIKLVEEVNRYSINGIKDKIRIKIFIQRQKNLEKMMMMNFLKIQKCWNMIYGDVYQKNMIVI